MQIVVVVVVFAYEIGESKKKSEGECDLVTEAITLDPEPCLRLCNLF